MPVTIERDGSNLWAATLRERRLRRGVIGDRGRRLSIALVNNMPDSAVLATQRQFVRLLEAGAESFDVTLSLTTLRSVPRSRETKREMAELYRSPADLALAAPDAIIVTGAEPRAAKLDEEPYWQELVALFDFARARTFATLASCLAAHALVLHRDAVQRVRSPRKWSGLYLTEVAGSHALTEGLSAGATPHSRWNGLDEQELEAKGYVVLTRSPESGVDMFAKDDDHLSLFFQGHPEYDGDTLAREFRRDVMRAVHEGGKPPEPPASYYPPEIEARLRETVAGMLAGTEAPHLPAEAMIGPEANWRRRGGIVINNWLTTIAARKAAARDESSLRARLGG
jgi:homoserine O-succinyltransferase/O-acetyltransferase